MTEEEFSWAIEQTLFSGEGDQRMSSMQRMTFIGNLGSDPELRAMPDGKMVANVSVAVSEKWKDKTTGQMQERTEWLKCVAFGKLAEIMGDYLKKGAKVYMEGKIRTRKWEDKQGETRYTTEVVVNEMTMLDGSRPQAETRPDPRQPGNPKPAPTQDFGSFDDDIPF